MLQVGDQVAGSFGWCGFTRLGEQVEMVATEHEPNLDLAPQTRRTTDRCQIKDLFVHITFESAALVSCGTAPCTRICRRRFLSPVTIEDPEAVASDVIAISPAALILSPASRI